MRYILYYIALVILIASCASGKKLIKEEHIKSLKDSVVFKDSLVVKHLTKVFDSIVYRDSVVLVLNEQGKVISREYFSIRDKLREKEAIITTQQAQQRAKVKVDKSQDKYEKKEKQYALSFYACLVSLILTLLLIIYITYKSRNLWTLLFRAVKR